MHAALVRYDCVVGLFLPPPPPFPAAAVVTIAIARVISETRNGVERTREGEGDTRGASAKKLLLLSQSHSLTPHTRTYLFLLPFPPLAVLHSGYSMSSPRSVSHPIATVSNNSGFIKCAREGSQGRRVTVMGVIQHCISSIW